MNQRTKQGIMIIGGGVLMIGLVVFNAIKDNKRNSREEDEQSNVYTEVPDGEAEEVIESKSDAYILGSSSNIEDYWNACEEDVKEEKDDESNQGGGGSDNISEAPKASSAAELFGEPSPQASNRNGASNPYRESASEREQRHQKRRDEAIDLATSMQQGGSGAVLGTSAQEKAEPARIDIPSSEVRKADALSSLDDDWNSSGGVSTLGEDDSTVAEDSTHPFKCMFVKDEKVKSGSRVSVRLLENLVVDGALIPKNTHLMANCNISTRLELEIASIEMGGRIYNIGYEAYDMDGSKGIYCPDTGDAKKTIRSRGTSIIGSSLSSRVGRVASDIVNTGISIAESANGERTVSIPSGYTFYIVKKKQQ